MPTLLWKVRLLCQGGVVKSALPQLNQIRLLQVRLLLTNGSLIAEWPLLTLTQPELPPVGRPPEHRALRRRPLLPRFLGLHCRR